MKIGLNTIRNWKMSNRLYRVLRDKYKAQILKAKPAVIYYLENPADYRVPYILSNGETTREFDDVDELIADLSEAESKLDTLERNFRKEYGYGIPE